MTTEWTPERLDALERSVRSLVGRVALLEGGPADVPDPPALAAAAAPPPAAPAIFPPPVVPTTGPAPGTAAQPARPRKPALTEELLAGKGLAWLGGGAVVLGIVFFLALAIRSGLISESLRVLLAGLGSAALAAAGLWLYQTKGKTQASLVLAGVGIAGMFATLISATQQYHLIAPELGLGLAGLVGAGATAAAIAIGSREIAGMGIIGALLAPVLTGAGATGISLAYVTIAFLAAAVVTVWRAWPAISLIAFLVTAPQLADWATDGASTGAGLVVTAIFGLVCLGIAAAHEAVRPVERLRPSVGALVALTTLVLVVVGLGVIGTNSDHFAAPANRWIIGLSLGHLAIGAGLLTRLRSSLIGPLVAAAGFALIAAGGLISTVMFGASTSVISLTYIGIALAGATAVALWRSWPAASLAAFAVTAPQLAVWATEAVGTAAGLTGIAAFALVNLAVAIAVELRRPDATVRSLSVALASINSTFATFAGLAVLGHEGADLGTAGDRWVLALALAHLAVGAALWARFRSALMGRLVAAIGFVLLAVTFAIFFGGPGLVVAWSAQAVVAAWLARRLGNPRALVGSAVLLAAAAAHCLAFEAPIPALRDGVTSLGDTLIGFGALTVAAIVTALLSPGDLMLQAEQIRVRSLGLAVGATSALYLVSVTIVELVGAGEQRAQVALSVLWALTGLGAIVGGLARRHAAVRLAGLGLLGLAMAKILFYDLANLDSISRALSFVAVGLLALAGAFAYQRVRAQVGKDEDHDAAEAEGPSRAN